MGSSRRAAGGHAALGRGVRHAPGPGDPGEDLPAPRPLRIEERPAPMPPRPAAVARGRGRPKGGGPGAGCLSCPYGPAPAPSPDPGLRPVSGPLVLMHLPYARQARPPGRGGLTSCAGYDRGHMLGALRARWCEGGERRKTWRDSWSWYRRGCPRCTRS
ncbi:MAG TPA: hypothetical protein DCQ64_10635 [Candidatus Rokubacteria bacterium]|nr:hypothetical protein [Candidatus Rokubacteria bacterium]